MSQPEPATEENAEESDEYWEEENTGEDTEGENDPDDETIHLEGTIQIVTAISIVIDGKTILINADTEIDGELTIGAAAEVDAVVQADGSLLALEIDVD